MDTDKHWWPQAEAISWVFKRLANIGDETYLQHALNSWEFTKKIHH
jgi:mannobiose 2-epimerase